VYAAPAMPPARAFVDKFRSGPLLIAYAPVDAAKSASPSVNGDEFNDFTLIFLLKMF